MLSFFPTCIFLGYLAVYGVIWFGTEMDVFTALLLLALLVTGGCLRRSIGVYASAHAFVIFTLLFIWGVYVVILQQGADNLLPHSYEF